MTQQDVDVQKLDAVVGNIQAVSAGAADKDRTKIEHAVRNGDIWGTGNLEMHGDGALGSEGVVTDNNNVRVVGASVQTEGV